MSQALWLAVSQYITYWNSGGYRGRCFVGGSVRWAVPLLVGSRWRVVHSRCLRCVGSRRRSGSSTYVYWVIALLILEMMFVGTHHGCCAWWTYSGGGRDVIFNVQHSSRHSCNRARVWACHIWQCVRGVRGDGVSRLFNEPTPAQIPWEKPTMVVVAVQGAPRRMVDLLCNECG
jgi:hypothetical protein